jgi:hypothetical protein
MRFPDLGRNRLRQADVLPLSDSWSYYLGNLG